MHHRQEIHEDLEGWAGYQEGQATGDKILDRYGTGVQAREDQQGQSQTPISEKLRDRKTKARSWAQRQNKRQACDIINIYLVFILIRVS